MADQRSHKHAEHVRVVTHHRSLKRKDRASSALTTLFKSGHTPHNTHNTSKDNGSANPSNPGSKSEASTDDPVWPPDGLSYRSHLTPEDAKTLITTGALSFQGLVDQASHISEEYGRYFAFADTIDGGDCPELTAPALGSGGQSLVLGGNFDKDRPWETLEQPSMSLCFGSIPGSVTLNRYVGSIARPLVAQPIPISSVVRREMFLPEILKRLRFLQGGLDDDPVYAQEYLYNKLVFDSDPALSEEPEIERQIFALSEVLNSPRWFDFQRAENQIVASYFHSDKEVIALIFYHQLMLSMQLLMNIKDSGLDDEHQTWLFNRLPEPVAWSVALAQLWRKNCSVEKTHGRNDDHILGPYRIRFRSRARQLKMLHEFAFRLKWPRMENVEDTMEEKRHPLEECSFQLMTLLSGLVLPGKYLSWALMGSLIDCDAGASRSLKDFTLFTPNFGFQYHRSSYWYWECIVAKVMAAARGVKQVAGWVGPVPYCSDIASSQCIAINQYQPAHTIDQRDIENMHRRSDAKGPTAEDYPVRQFGYPTIETDAVDTIRFERIELKPAEYDVATERTDYDSCVVFAVRGFFTDILPVRLRYDVSFIAAPPCKSGPHVLHRTFAPVVVAPVDVIWRLNFWAGCCVCPLDKKGDKCKHRQQWPELFGQKKMLVVRAFGRKDNDVFARAWCSYMGLSAVVADRNTCVACAVRNAVAAKVSVVILIGGSKGEAEKKKKEEEEEEAESASVPRTQSRHRRRN